MSLINTFILNIAFATETHGLDSEGGLNFEWSL